MNSNLSRRNLEVMLRFVLDKKTAEDVKQGVKTIDDAMNKLQQKMESQRKIYLDLRDTLNSIQGGSTKSLAISTGFIAGLFTYSQKYINNLEETTELSKKWNATSKDIQKSHERIGNVVATEMLPLYNKAAGITKQIAGFVESHPEVVKAAINTGLFIAGFSALTLAVSRGIRFIADVTYITTAATQMLAAKAMQDAANKQLAASTAMKIQTGGQIAQNLRKDFGYTPAGTAGMSLVSSAALVVTGLIASGFVAYFIDNMISKTKLGDEIQKAQKNIVANSKNPYPGVISPRLREEMGIEAENPLDKILQKIKEFFDELSNSAEQVEQATTELRGHDYEKEIVKAYTEMREAEVVAAQQYKRDIISINEKINKEILRAAINNSKAIESINQRYYSTIKRITDDYHRDSREAEASFARERARIVRDGGIEIQRMEEDSQERLRKLREELENKTEDDVRKRDALSLVKHINEYEKERKEEIANTNKEIARRRQDLAIRLQDLTENFNAERARRREEYLYQMKEAEQNRKEQLEAQKISYEEQLKALEESRKEQLQALEERYREENIRRREAFIAMIRDLDAALLGEQQRKQQYYKLMLADAEQFLSQYRSIMAGNNSNPTGGGGGGTKRASGGYAVNPGIYWLAEDRRREYVMNNRLTQMAEAALGGSIDERKMASMINSSRVYNDYRRIDSRISDEDIRKITNASVRAWEEVLDA